MTDELMAKIDPWYESENQYVLAEFRLDYRLTGEEEIKRFYTIAKNLNEALENLRKTLSPRKQIEEYGFKAEIAKRSGETMLERDKRIEREQEAERQFQESLYRARHEKPHKQTNFEWLKSLSVEEKAEWLNKINLATVPILCPKKVPKEWEKHGGKCGYGVGWADCDAKCILMWLQEEHEDA